MSSPIDIQTLHHDHSLAFLVSAKTPSSPMPVSSSSSIFGTFTSSTTNLTSFSNNYTHLPSPPLRADSDSDDYYSCQSKPSPSLSLCSTPPSSISSTTLSGCCASPIDNTVTPSKKNSVTLPAHYLLFDLDGTLVNSTPAVEFFWRTWAVEYGLDGEEILKTSHGRRSLDVIKEQLPHRPDMHTQEYVNFMEKDIPAQLGHMALPIPGAQRLLQQIEEKCGALADNQWAICTSGSRGLASGWLKVFGWKEPIVFVTSDRCTKGKPHPYGYFTAAKTLEYHEGNGTVLSNHRFQHQPHNLNTPPSSPIAISKLEERKAESSDVTKFLKSYDEAADQDMSLEIHTSNRFGSVVFEDAPAGILAGKNSGAIVIGLATTYSPERVFEAGADYVVSDLRSISIKTYDAYSKQVVLEIHDPIFTPADRD